MNHSVCEIVRTNNIVDDSLGLYHKTDPDEITQYYGLTIDDKRCHILAEFVKALTSNGVESNTPLCLVFDCAGSAKFEMLFVLVAMRVCNISNIRVIFSDILYNDIRERPEISHLQVPVDFVNGDCALFDAIQKVHKESYKVMLNALFIQKVYASFSNLDTPESTYLECCKKQYHDDCKRIEYMKMCMPYGIYFTIEDYVNRGNIEYTELRHICKNFKEFALLQL